LGRVESQVIIRPGTAADLPRVAELWRELVRYNVARDGRLPDATSNGAEKWRHRLEGLLENPTGRLYVAEATGRLVGFSTGFLRYAPDVFEQQKTGHVSDIFVDSGWRRQRVAQRLLSAVTGWFQEEKVDHIELGLVAKNSAAISFWRGVGAQEYRMQMWLPVDWEG